VTVRERNWVPPPHDLLQVDHEPHAPTWQWIGHAPRLHVVVSDRLPQATPPLALTVVVVRVRSAEPLPQDSEQVLQLPKAVWSQSTGQACALHVCSAVVGPHIFPPKSTSVVVVRARVDKPEPHDLLQMVHEVQPD
jgi:hypothetical protein